MIPLHIYLILGTIIISSCQIEVGSKNKKGDEENDTILPPVIVQEVTKNDISSILKLNSTLQPAKLVKIYPQSVGMVNEILTEEGQFVRKDQVLARLDNIDQSLAVERANSKLSRAKYDLERAEEMYKNRLLSENELRQYQLIFHEDEINLTQAQITLDRSVIKAPFAGTITEREIVAGDKVNPSRPLFALVDGSSMKLDVWVNEDVARIMKVGMIGMVMPFSSISLDTVEAVLVRVNPVIDPQYGKRKATFKIKGESTMLKPGQFVDINLSLLTHSDVLIIPKRAIVHQAGSAVVFVCNDSVAVRKVVQTDLETGDDIEITHGIDLGDFIIVEGQSTLKDSTVVNVITPEL